MNSNDLLAYCKYYKGEQNHPFGNNKELAQLWECERYWAHAGEMNQVEVLKSYLQELMSAGVIVLSIEDEVPITLKAVLYHTFCQRNGLLYTDGGEQFKAYYQMYY